MGGTRDQVRDLVGWDLTEDSQDLRAGPTSPVWRELQAPPSIQLRRDEMTRGIQGLGVLRGCGCQVNIWLKFNLQREANTLQTCFFL